MVWGEIKFSSLSNGAVVMILLIYIHGKMLILGWVCIWLFPFQTPGRGADGVKLFHWKSTQKAPFFRWVQLELEARSGLQPKVLAADSCVISYAKVVSLPEYLKVSSFSSPKVTFEDVTLSIFSSLSSDNRLNKQLIKKIIGKLIYNKNRANN